MRFTIKLTIDDGSATETIEEVMHFDKGFSDHDVVGLSLQESKQILKMLQSKIIFEQAKKYIASKRMCS
jgi:hypothetical protein